MKKEMIISCIVVAIIIILDIITQKYTKASMNEIEEVLVSVREELKKENDIEAKEKIEEAKSKWDKIKEKLVIYIEHEELEKVEMYIIESRSNIETKEYEMAIQTIDVCNFIMDHIKDKYELSLQNIF